MSARFICRATVIAIVAGALAPLVPAPALASPQDYGFSSVSASLSTAQAGAHPDLTTAFQITPDPNIPDAAAARTREVKVDLPPGLVGNPAAFPQCPLSEFSQEGLPPQPGKCPQDSQVGTVLVDTNLTPFPVLEPLYNLPPPASGASVARLGFIGVADPFIIDLNVRSNSDYGITALVEGTGAVDLLAATTTIWGVPADPSHDADRYSPQDAVVCTLHFPTCPAPQPSGLQPTPFLTNATSCGPEQVGFAARSFEIPNVWVSATAPLAGITGCAAVPFEPTIDLQPTTTAASSPSGMDVDLAIPQDGLLSPNGLGSADLKDAVVTLPEGLSVNPAAADGLAGCSEAQIGLTSENPISFDTADPSCPDASKVGTAEIHTPVLANPLEGSLYLAEQTANPFHSLLAGYLVAKGAGVILKLAGRFDLDPRTGRITATFDNNPQLPFSDLTLHFKGGSRGVLATPPACGSYAIGSQLTPWSGNQPVSLTSSFAINQGCVTGGFAPQLDAGVTNAVAGSSSAFVLRLTRADGDQNVASVDTTLPPGLVAKLAGVPLCPPPQAATGACPAGSQVGYTAVGVGVGPDPLYIPQAGRDPTAVYLAGAYNGAPYSLVIKVPAQAGPFNLGTVVVRAGIYVDPTSAQVTVKSDPLPQIMQGIPLSYRDIRVIVDRPGFIRTPTSCNPMQIQADVQSAPAGAPISLNGAGVGFSAAAGRTAHLASRLQVGDCQELGFSPKLKIALTGKGKTRSGNHPTLTATLTDPSGQANIRMAKVALPLSMALDPKNSQHVCNYNTALAVHGGAVGCPPSTIVGTATAVTPLLDHPLTGPVYLVQGIRFNAQGQPIHTLPSLLIPLRGQIALDLRAQSAVSGGKLVTTFSTIPDAPVSKFTLKINGGRKGILVITGRGKSICGKKQVSNATFGAQSGKTKRFAIKMSTPCRATKSKKKSKAKKGLRHERGRAHGSK